MEIMIGKYDAEYLKICHAELLRYYNVSEAPYVSDAIVANACAICINTLVSVFEDIIQNIVKSTSDVRFLMTAYSELKEMVNLDPRCNYGLRKLCRHAIGELPKLELTHSSDINIDAINLSRLFCITELIEGFVQKMSIVAMITDAFQLELYDNIFAITIIPHSLYGKLQPKINEISSRENIFRGSCYSEQQGVTELNHIEDLFEEDATSFLDRHLGQDYPMIINADEISESDFMGIISGNIICLPNHCEIVEYTDIVTENKESQFLNGLIYMRGNINMLNSILKPYNKSTKMRFRPIIEIKVDGVLRYVTTRHITFEAIDQIISNLIPYGELPLEWEQNQKVKEFAKYQKQIHESQLMDPAEEIIKRKELVCLRNKKSINGIDLDNVIVPDTDNKRVGEIDFIIIDHSKRIVYVNDCKYMKRQDNFAGFRNDKSKFFGEKGYNKKLSYKLWWVSNHLNEVAAELKCKINISDYKVLGFFTTNSFVYYGLVSEYPIIHLSDLDRYLDTSKRLLEL
ncbi:MAG: hypothetical protein SNI05_06650 [Rikenellaceae bacterium]